MKTRSTKTVKSVNQGHPWFTDFFVSIHDNSTISLWIQLKFCGQTSKFSSFPTFNSTMDPTQTREKCQMKLCEPYLSIPLWIQLKRRRATSPKKPNFPLSIPPWIQLKPICEHQKNQGFFIIPNLKKVCEPGVLQKPRQVHRLRLRIRYR